MSQLRVDHDTPPDEVVERVNWALTNGDQEIWFELDVEESKKAGFNIYVLRDPRNGF